MARSSTTFYALLAAGSISAWACGPAGDPTSRVAQALQQEQIDGVSLNWEADKFLILNGTVESQTERAQAGRVADRAVGRGATVINELLLTGGEDVSDLDGTLEQRLESIVVSDPTLRERDLSIDVNDRVVTIRGDVQSDEERDRVEQLAWQLAGVRDVANAVQVVG